MSKFEYRNDDDDYEDDYDDEDGSDLEFDDDEDEIYNDLLEQELALQSDQLDVAEKELHQRMINDALILNSKSWLWSFYSLETKLKMINKTFVFMKGLTDLPPKQN
jgi:hypothetical protein